jgi:transposase
MTVSEKRASARAVPPSSMIGTSRTCVPCWWIGPWTTAEIRELIQQEFGVLYSPDQVVRILRKRLKIHLNKPFPRNYRRPPDAEQRLRADFKEAFEILGAYS